MNIPTDTWAGDTQLKAGDYKVQVEGNQATFKQGKQAIQVPASMEKNAGKTSQTILETSGTNLQAIDIGGTTMKIASSRASAHGLPENVREKCSR